MSEQVERSLVGQRIGADGNCHPMFAHTFPDGNRSLTSTGKDLLGELSLVHVSFKGLGAEMSVKDQRQMVAVLMFPELATLSGNLIAANLAGEDDDKIGDASLELVHACLEIFGTLKEESEASDD